MRIIYRRTLFISMLVLRQATENQTIFDGTKLFDLNLVIYTMIENKHVFYNETNILRNTLDIDRILED